MAGYIFQTYRLRKRESADASETEIFFTIRDTENEFEAAALVETFVAALTSTGAFDDLCLSDKDYSHDGGGVWTGTLRFSTDTPKTTPTFSFDTRGGTVTVKQGLEIDDDGTVEKRYVPKGKTATDYQGVINKTDDKVEGTEITVPAFKFSITKYYDLSAEDPDFIMTLKGLTGCTNDKAVTFTVGGVAAPKAGHVTQDALQSNKSQPGQVLKFEPGELLFLGCAGSQKGAEACEITFDFAASDGVEYDPKRPKDSPGLAVGDIEHISKKGWDYLWVVYTRGTDGGTGSGTMVPAQVNVNKVYPDGDFSDLNLE